MTGDKEGVGSKGENIHTNQPLIYERISWHKRALNIRLILEGVTRGKEGSGTGRGYQKEIQKVMFPRKASENGGGFQGGKEVKNGAGEGIRKRRIRAFPSPLITCTGRSAANRTSDEKKRRIALW